MSAMSAMSAAVGEGSSFGGGAAELVTEKLTTEKRMALQISALTRANENFSGKIR
jgi:hypothetical protein